MIHGVSLHTDLQLFANATRSYADRIHRQSELRRNSAPGYYLGPLFANVVFQNQCAVLRVKFFEAAVEAIQEILVTIWLPCRLDRVSISGYALEQFKVRVRSLWAPQ